MTDFPPKDPTDIPEVAEALHDHHALKALGFEQNDSGEYVTRGCTVIVYPCCGQYEVDILLPNGAVLFLDVDALRGVPPPAEPRDVEKGE
jgi:hypothetical protein